MVISPLDAESVFFGGDDLLSMLCTVAGTPKAKQAQSPKQNLPMSVSK
jgi:hypothetical protein